MEPEDDGDRPGDRRIDKRRPRGWVDDRWASERNEVDRLSPEDVYAWHEFRKREQERVDRRKTVRGWLWGVVGTLGMSVLINGVPALWVSLWETLRRWIHDSTG